MAKTYNIGSTGIVGFDEVMKNLNEEISQIRERTLAGLIKAAIVIRRDMDKTPPLIPVDTGNLRASWFVTTSKGVKTNTPAFTGDKANKVQESYNATVAEASALVAASTPQTPFIVMGFGANYTMPVHEMYGKGDVEWSRPNSGPKFFESAIKRNKNKVLGIINAEAKIRK